MIPLEGAMGLTTEIGLALDYAATWMSTNQSLRSLATAPALGPNLADSLPSERPRRKPLHYSRLETRRRKPQERLLSRKCARAGSLVRPLQVTYKTSVQRRFGTWLDALAKTNVRQAVAEGRLPNTFVTSSTASISRGYLASRTNPALNWIEAPDVWDTATGRAWDFMAAREAAFYEHESFPDVRDHRFRSSRPRRHRN